MPWGQKHKLKINCIEICRSRSRWNYKNPNSSVLQRKMRKRTEKKNEKKPATSYDFSRRNCKRFAFVKELKAYRLGRSFTYKTRWTLLGGSNTIRMARAREYFNEKETKKKKRYLHGESRSTYRYPFCIELLKICLTYGKKYYNRRLPTIYPLHIDVFRSCQITSEE